MAAIATRGTKYFLSIALLILGLLPLSSCTAGQQAERNGVPAVDKKDDDPEAAYNSLAMTPPMGWNSWNFYEKDINEVNIKATADAMVSSGMRDEGYEYLVLDDAWMAAERDEKYTEAVVLLNEVLEVNPKHIEARFRLARIYHRQLKRKGSAIHEYENLMEILPKGAPYHMTAREAVEELLGKRAVPEPIKPLEWKT